MAPLDPEGGRVPPLSLTAPVRVTAQPEVGLGG
jgi:hypothetical protein